MGRQWLSQWLGLCGGAGQHVTGQVQHRLERRCILTGAPALQRAGAHVCQLIWRQLQRQREVGCAAERRSSQAAKVAMQRRWHSGGNSAKLSLMMLLASHSRKAANAVSAAQASQATCSVTTAATTENETSAAIAKFRGVFFAIREDLGCRRLRQLVGKEGRKALQGLCRKLAR